MKKNATFFMAILMMMSLFTNAQKNIISVRPLNFLEGLYGLSYERTFLRNFSFGVYGDVGTSSIGPISNYTANLIKDEINKNTASTGFKADKLKAETSGWGIVPEVRAYLSLGGAPKGFFLGLYAPIRQISYKFTGEGTYTAVVNGTIYTRDINMTLKNEKTFFGIGGMVGYHLVLLKLVSLEFMVGAAYNQGFENIKTTELSYDVQSGQAATPTGYSTSGSPTQALKAFETLNQVLPRFGINLGIGF